ncbi:MAG: hypothetical protein JSR80_07385 [Verrucomicrobia bacterium]|nr:hypothetical protein [Verrucomicrobiota bacterium]
MRIVISNRYRPFSHRKGISCLVPGTTLVATCYPTRTVLCDLVTQKTEEQEHPLLAPCDHFTVFQDLERGRVQIEGSGPCGFFRRFIEGRPPQDLERLSFGVSKQLNWDFVHERCDPREIFPLWHRLAQLTSYEEETGKGTLLAACDNDLQPYLDLYRAGFESLLVPRAQDTDYQGFKYPPAKHPLAVVSAGLRLRRLFLDQARILPSLPPQFPAGRLTQAKTPFGLLDLEWSKKQIRRMVLEVGQSGEILFDFKDVKRFRLRLSPQDRGHVCSVEERLIGEIGQRLYFDCFQK